MFGVLVVVLLIAAVVGSAVDAAVGFVVVVGSFR